MDFKIKLSSQKQSFMPDLFLNYQVALEDIEIVPDDKVVDPV